MLRHFVRSTALRHRQEPNPACPQVIIGFGTESTQKKPSSDDSSSTTNEFWKSFGILLQEPKEAKLVGRWDWHLWQLCAALLPALGIVALVHIARSDMRNQEAVLLKRREDKAAEETAAEAAKASDKQTASPPPSNGLHKELQGKLAEMEKALQIMQIRQLMQQATKTGINLGPQEPSQPTFPRASASSLSDSRMTEQGQRPALVVSAKHSSAINQGAHISEPLIPAKQQPAVPIMHGSQDKQQADLPREAHGPPTAVSAVRQYLHQKVQHSYMAVKSALFGAEAVKDGAGQNNARDTSVRDDQ